MVVSPVTRITHNEICTVDVTMDDYIYIYTYAFLVLLFWFFRETAFILVVAGKKHCCLPKTFLLQMIKNSEDERKPTNLLQVTVMPQLINWKQVD